MVNWWQIFAITSIQMSATKLTHTKINGAKPGAKPYKLSDTDRLYVLIAVNGKKYWKWNFRLDGKDSTYTLGTFPDLGLSEARERRIALEKLVQKGIDPKQYDKDLILKAKADKAVTFWSVAEEWIETNKVKWSPSYAKQVELTMHRYVRDTEIGTRAIRQIATNDIFKLVSGVANRTELKAKERKTTAPALATLLHQWCHAVFRFAVVSGSVDRNPVADFKASDAFSKPKAHNNRALTPQELKNLLEALRVFTGHRTTGIAIDLLMLTFVRTGELRCATWDEFDLDEKKSWTIPAARMKVKNMGDHVVPLSTQALALLNELKKITGVSKTAPHWLFRNTRESSTCMSATTINRALERMGFNGKGTIGFAAHGFRGTASTLLHEDNFRPEVIEAQLAHKERNAVKAAYNKAKYVSDRTKMMQSWADYIDKLRESKNISTIE